MTDVHSKKVRSYNMSRIKSKNTKPEILVRKHLHAQGYRYRLHVKDLPGKPDIVLPKYKTVIFVHGCFWHGHKGCKYFVVPKTNTVWWVKKINSNITVDKGNTRRLNKMHINVLVVRECQLKKDKVSKTLELLIKRIKTRQ